MPEDDEQLEKCPWCSKKPTVEPWHSGRTCVCCENDLCLVQPMVTGKTKKEALEKWNSRGNV